MNNYSCTVSINAHRDRMLRGYVALTAPPTIGAIVVYADFPSWKPHRRIVSNVRDHRPVDAAPEKNAIVEFENGEWAYWWNLYQA